MNITLNLNYLLVFGMTICCGILIYMLLKHIFANDNTSNNQKSRGNPNEKNLESNIDFFNTTSKIIEKSNNIVDEKNNKVYQIIDLGDKFLIMEQSYFIPQNVSEINENVVLNDSTQFYEKNDYAPEQIKSEFEEQLLTQQAEEMAAVIDASETNYEELHRDVYDLAVNEPVHVSPSGQTEAFL